MSFTRDLLFLATICLPSTRLVGQESELPLGNGDVNADGRIDISDAIYIINMQFHGGPEPVPMACLTPAPESEDELDPSRHSNATFSSSFFPQACRFSTDGTNPFFILKPGYQLVLEGDDEGTEVLLKVTVLDEIEIVDGIPTRVVEERESKDGELKEISRNFFTICQETGDLYYFGEDVDIFQDGGVVSHAGAWRAGVGGAKAGVLIPGSPMIGARFYQEVAPDAALDRSEVITVLEEMEVPAGTFKDVLFMYETTPLEPQSDSIKYYAPGVGLIRDDILELVEHGFMGG